MIKKTALTFFLLAASLIHATEYTTDPLATSQGNIYIISTFPDRDYFTVFTSTGMPIWEIPFSSKIQSWKIDNGLLYIFSKMRDNKVYFLSCFDTQKGALQWEKPIYSPSADPQMMQPPTQGEQLLEQPAVTENQP